MLVWPYVDQATGKSVVQQAYYGRRATGRPAFYLHGAEIHGVMCWAYMPEVPDEFFDTPTTVHDVTCQKIGGET